LFEKAEDLEKKLAAATATISTFATSTNASQDDATLIIEELKQKLRDTELHLSDLDEKDKADVQGKQDALAELQKERDGHLEDLIKSKMNLALASAEVEDERHKSKDLKSKLDKVTFFLIAYFPIIPSNRSNLYTFY